MIIRPNPLEPFKPLYNLPKGTWMVVNMGGRGGGKSYEGSKWTNLQVVVNNKRAVVLRDEKTTISDSILNEIKNRFTELDTKANGIYSRVFQVNQYEITHIESKKKVLFTKGFRASSNEKQANLKSLSDVDIAIIEEFEDITDEFAFNKFADGVRNEGSIIFINSNIPDMNHWFIRRYYDLEDTEHDGYYKLRPKNIQGVVFLFSTWETNPHLPKHIKAKYKAYGDQTSPFYDIHYYLTQILGYCSSGRKGQIFKNWKRISNEEFNELPYKSYYGLDFGWSESPMALVETKQHNGRIYARQLICERHLDLKGLAIKLIELGFTNNDLIVADSAEPKTINKLRNGWTSHELTPEEVVKYPQLLKGFYVIGATKGSDSVTNGINKIKEFELYLTDDSLEWWLEYVNYCWAVDKNGNATDTPKEGNDHLMDALRYVLTAKGRLYD
jgi:phage terminase large subunit